MRAYIFTLVTFFSVIAQLSAATLGDLITPDNPTICYPSSLTCPSSTSPLRLEYAVIEQSVGVYQYDFTMTAIDKVGKYNQIVFGDIPGQLFSSSQPENSYGALLNWVSTSTDAPFVNGNYVIGGHNGPYIATPDYWQTQPSIFWEPEIGDIIHWSGTASVKVEQGDMFFSATDGSSSQWQVNFYPATLVPVPAAVWLFGSGLIGLIGFARRKQT